MNVEIRSLHVVEYSVRQNSFHIQTVGEMLDSNLRTFARLVPTEYAVLALTKTYEEASAVVSKLRPQVDQLVMSDRERRIEEIRRELGVSLTFNDFN